MHKLNLAKFYINLIFQNWKKLFFLSFLGGCFGFFYAWMQPIRYKATLTFVVEDGKSGGSLSNLASLAGQFGVDVGGSGSGSLIAGDNILYYFQSKSLAREVLLSKISSKNNTTIADKYCQLNGLKEQWSKIPKIGNIAFLPLDSNPKYSRVHDSLLNSLINKILQFQFSVHKIDKKAGFFEVNCTMEDEELSKLYCERLVTYAVKRYLEIKTKRQKLTVENLQKRVDSIAILLTSKTLSSANYQTINSTMDINPIYKTSTSVGLETNTRDKTLLATIFASVTQNLELAKFTLSQETPVIQIVDYPVAPLLKIKKSRLQFAIVFSVLACLLAFLFIYLKHQKNKNDK